MKPKVKHATECPRCETPLSGSKCPGCGLWVFPDENGRVSVPGAAKEIQDNTVLLSEVKSAEDERIDTGIFNFVFSGFDDKGIVQTSCTLLGGLRGGGKTTGLLQLASHVAKVTKQESLFISAEMDLGEIRLFADRLKIKNTNRIRMVPAMTGGVEIGSVLYNRKFGICIIDSLQGFVGDDNEAQGAVCKICKDHAMKLKAPFVIISHINKDGDFAGLEKLQHAVDTLLKISVDEESGIRTIDVEKNRFGKAQIFAEYEMTEHGLVPYVDPEDDEDDDDDDD
jgi:DNA repair protein RadA/Sms